MVTIGESYVERTEKALVETAILEELRRGPGLAADDLAARVLAIGGFDEKVDHAFVRSCVRRLSRDGHVVEDEGRFTLTDDGRADVRKIENALCAVTAAAVPGVTLPPEFRSPLGGRDLSEIGGVDLGPGAAP